MARHASVHGRCLRATNDALSGASDRVMAAYAGSSDALTEIEGSARAACLQGQCYRSATALGTVAPGHIAAS